MRIKIIAALVSNLTLAGLLVLAFGFAPYAPHILF